MSGFGGFALLLLAAGALAPGQVATPVADVPEGEARSNGELRDPDFRVSTRQFGLERRVEMYQWRAGEAGYRRVWNQAPIDSAGFAPGHENPPAVPILSERWWAADPTLDGAPLDVSVLKSLGQWRRFRPGFSRLPANLAAAFQPEGDGLGTAENPLDPQIGDLRVSWHELALPPLAGQVAMRNGAWQPTPEAVRPVQSNAEAQPVETAARESVRALWPWLVVVLLPVLAAVAWRRRGKRSR
ncbi:MAG TPA: TMEM43 family protein [Lysobacter sp.]|nr:TMEM43 family protein [Lysobacter sp.]